MLRRIFYVAEIKRSQLFKSTQTSTGKLILKLLNKPMFSDLKIFIQTMMSINSNSFDQDILKIIALHYEYFWLNKSQSKLLMDQLNPEFAYRQNENTFNNPADQFWQNYEKTIKTFFETAYSLKADSSCLNFSPFLK
ncbi:hypothetical protein IB642_00005 [Allofrancisella guangzhouensis]|uniref:Uncharacterized protein n=1 Tax=Allofrancisella guangzhouensis TaxID=594679 RepID=A0A0A8E6F5_9GAMM|nr:hypothetical protein [Allofrancisella guangzhouensis]AJC49162.1 hypothetical protein SD28_05705 [Allofrancisella guangzhouensis]MBK2026781.1 hypothetical protein [Allofrancisella guangzhouensis]MBK2043401.1 hypothetical protein [Allofrancisella guangzhouensis]MBK2045339.1 hypothetical protein [Allofrancisella guangzhouensis]